MYAVWRVSAITTPFAEPTELRTPTGALSNRRTFAENREHLASASPTSASATLAEHRPPSKSPRAPKITHLFAPRMAKRTQ